MAAALVEAAVEGKAGAARPTSAHLLTASPGSARGVRGLCRNCPIATLAQRLRPRETGASKEEGVMAKAVWLSFAAGLLQAAQPVAAGCLPAGDVAGRMDEY